MKYIKNVISTMWEISWIRALLISTLIAIAAVSIYQLGYEMALYDNGIGGGDLHRDTGGGNLHLPNFPKNKKGGKEMDNFQPFRYCINERDNESIKFTIMAETPHKLQVRFPEYDYIKIRPSVSVEFNQEQLLLFLLAHDEKQCLDFAEKLFTNMGLDKQYIEKMRSNPAFAKVQNST